MNREEWRQSNFRAMTTCGISRQLVLFHIILLLPCCVWVVLGTSSSKVCKSCHFNATCMNEEKRYYCQCNFGLIGNGISYCIDKDECQIGANRICGNHTKCHNTYGSFYCVCLKGYKPSNNNDTFIPNDGTYCTDIDECEEQNICGLYGKCKNIPGSYECRCKEGYMPLNGTEPFQADGDDSFCTAVDCGFPPVIPHSYVDLASKTTFGSHVMYRCAPGFILQSGHNMSFCTAKGTWEKATIKCKVIDCELPPNLPNSQVDSLSNTTYGSMATYRCAAGFIADGGHSTSVCTDKGSWEGASLKCKAIDCGLPLALPNTVILSLNNTTLGNNVTYGCADGFVEENGHYSSVCTEEGKWKGATLVCKAIDCGPPLVLPNTVVSLLSNTTCGNTVRYRCSNGFVAASGNDTSICTKHGIWDGATLVCKAIDCGPPSVLANTVIHSAVNTTFGNNVTYKCTNGFISESGYDTSVCMENGKWEGVTLLCKAIDCGRPKPLPHTVINSPSNTTFGNIVTYECAEGFVADSGNSAAVCTADGIWEGATLICKEINCGHPPSIPKTEMIWSGAAKLGSEVHYKCVKGFYNSENRTVSRCTLNESWDNVTFTCKVKEDLISSLSVFNDTCLRWKKSIEVLDWTIFYELIILGTRWHKKDFIHEMTLNVTTDSEFPTICLNLFLGANYTVTVIAVSPELPKLKMNISLQTAMRKEFEEITIVNETCLQWTRHFEQVGILEVYTVFIQGRKQNPEELLQNIMLNLSTEKKIVVLCLDLPSSAEYVINVTESSTGFSANVQLNISANKNGIISGTTLLNETCLLWNRRTSRNGFYEIYNVYLQVGRWYPKEYLQNLLFNISTDQNASTLCLEIPVGLTVTEAPSNFAAQSQFPSVVNGPIIKNLTIVNETCLHWIRDSRIRELYMIFIHGVRWYDKDFNHKVMFNFSTSEELPVVCLELRPGTNYTVTMHSAACPLCLANISVTTKIADPSLPKVIFVATQGQLPRVSFQAIEETHGPISSYQVFVMHLVSLCTFTCESLEVVSYFSNMSSALGYITAEFFSRDISDHLEFSLGDRQYYGDFYNAPLAREKDYCIILRIVSSWNKMTTQSCMILAEIKDSSPQQHHMIIVILGAIAFVCFTLFLSYSFARCCKRL